MRDGHPATRCATSRELRGYDAPPPGLTSGARKVAERLLERKVDLQIAPLHSLGGHRLGFQFQKLADEEPARKLAFEHPNLSVYCADAAVIGGVAGPWRPGDLPKNWSEIRASFWGNRGGDHTFLLGDFASFCRFCALSYSSDLAHPLVSPTAVAAADADAEAASIAA